MRVFLQRLGEDNVWVLATLPFGFLPLIVVVLAGNVWLGFPALAAVPLLVYWLVPRIVRWVLASPPSAG